jgi:hypothetical protein
MSNNIFNPWLIESERKRLQEELNVYFVGKTLNIKVTSPEMADVLDQNFPGWRKFMLLWRIVADGPVESVQVIFQGKK